MTMFSQILRLSALATIAAISIAATPYPLGTSIRSNIDAHAGPLPTYAGVPMEGSNALLSARAVRAYRNGKVKPLFIQRLSNVANSGGAENSGGGEGGAGGGGTRGGGAGGSPQQ
jgi:uncharacterized membrane protein YgcG